MRILFDGQQFPRVLPDVLNQRMEKVSVEGKGETEGTKRKVKEFM